MEMIAEIRRLHFVENVTTNGLAKQFRLCRPTLRKHLKTDKEPVYPARQYQPHPKLGVFLNQLNSWLESDASLPKKRRGTAQRLFECLQVEGYQGSYSAVQRHVKDWKRSRPASPTVKQAFIPLACPPGETRQFDWSHETAVIGGVEQVVKVAHFRLSYSRQVVVIAYPRETQEMVMDAHNQAFAYFGGVPKRMVSATAPASPKAPTFGALPPASL